MAAVDKHWEKEPQNHGQEVQASASSQEPLGQKERTRATDRTRLGGTLELGPFQPPELEEEHGVYSGTL